MTHEDRHIGLAHGNGGRFMRELIEEVFAQELANPQLDTSADAVALPWNDQEGVLVYTTDGFTVQPLEFPGGNIGSLAVHGTTNDLAVAGATPRYLSLNAFIEEGLEVEVLRRVIGSLGQAARESGVVVACGDTKVLPRGHGGGLYLATTGIGVRPREVELGISMIEAGDQIVVSGAIGAHGIAVMLAREQFGLRGDLASDAASVLPLTLPVRSLPGLRFMRDPTRGGLATVMHEIARGTRCGVRLSEAAIPVQDPVRAVCEMLGYDPYYLACEGRVVAVAAPETAKQILATWQGLQSGREAAIVGTVTSGQARVVLETSIGGERYLEELEDDPLPRIC
ncbi:MAG TPA: hydrogenase expression/formation protein HypE [Steroidobacteraceae bacterium]|nr:hydrogenase expression/formation protein HypE [Steroidobacteraceae bacterium]